MDDENDSSSSSSPSPTPAAGMDPSAAGAVAFSSKEPTGLTSSNIRIFVRMRPPRSNSKLHITPGRYYCTNPELPNSDEKNGDTSSKIGFLVPKDETQTINHQKESYDYRFHRVFDEKATQEEVFDYVAKDVVLNVLDGYNGTIFAYGQTGSGKTFTITGGAERYADRGLIPRALQFMYKETKKRQGYHFDIAISYLEIYNENGYDLLDSTRDAKKLEDLPKVKLMEDSDQTIHLSNLSHLPALTEEEALNLLFVGDTNRMIAETPSNPASSRSHCIFIITVTSRKDGDDTIRRSKLHLVDLAGSERTSRTGINGKLFTEASYINLSLHYLEQVILALYEKGLGKRSHIPYRNSMMTSVLRDSLGGNCRTTMIATVAPEDELMDESISTCRFAQRVALISNLAHVNEEVDPRLLIAKLRREIVRLKAELAIARGESSDEPLPDYEKDRVKAAVEEFIGGADDAVVWGDARKIRYAFEVLRDMVLEGRRRGGGGGSSEVRVVQQQQTGVLEGKDDTSEVIPESLKFVSLDILINMINQYKQQYGDQPLPQKPLTTVLSIQSLNPTTNTPQPQGRSILPPPAPNSTQTNLRSSIPQFTTEKARAFEIFKESYPSGGWIDGQKKTLSVKYAEAKKLGEEANALRMDIKQLKQTLSVPSDTFPSSDEDRASLRAEVGTKVSKYKEKYQRLKDLKMEIEHLQHLLEQARVRLTRDFEHWYLNVYLNVDDGGMSGGKDGENGEGDEITEENMRKNRLDPTQSISSTDTLTPTLSSASLLEPSSPKAPISKPYQPASAAQHMTLAPSTTISNRPDILLLNNQTAQSYNYKSSNHQHRPSMPSPLPRPESSHSIDQPSSSAKFLSRQPVPRSSSSLSTHAQHLERSRPPSAAERIRDVGDDVEAFRKAKENLLRVAAGVGRGGGPPSGAGGASGIPGVGGFIGRLMNAADGRR
ncbi:Kinesin- protein 6 [Phlyctochytrium planicorne]|nr:Kinesin- protein 6 [Phlyctochytrium planicorne]